MKLNLHSDVLVLKKFVPQKFEFCISFAFWKSAILTQIFKNQTLNTKFSLCQILNQTFYYVSDFKSKFSRRISIHNFNQKVYNKSTFDAKISNRLRFFTFLLNNYKHLETKKKFFNHIKLFARRISVQAPIFPDTFTFHSVVAFHFIVRPSYMQKPAPTSRDMKEETRRFFVSISSD